METLNATYVKSRAASSRGGLIFDHMLIETGNGPGEPSSKGAKRSPNKRWHAVAIVPGAGACQAAESCRGRRFLSIEAPHLPLPECNTAQCRCKYRHYEDRRGPPRRGEMKRASRAAEERRQTRGRRETD
jgi:hypothetical protein